MGDIRRRIVWNATERKDLINAALDIEEQNFVLPSALNNPQLELLRQAQDRLVREGKLDPDRRRTVGSLPRETFDWYLDGLVEGKRRRDLEKMEAGLARERAREAAKSPPPAPEPEPEPAAPPVLEELRQFWAANQAAATGQPVPGPVQKPLPVPPVPPPTASRPEARPEPPQPADRPGAAPMTGEIPVPPHLLRREAGKVTRGSDYYPVPPSYSTPPPLPVLAGLDAIPIPDLLAALFRRLLGISGPDNPAVLQRLDTIANLLLQQDQRLANLERKTTKGPLPTDNGEVRELRIGGAPPVQVRVAPAAPPAPPSVSVDRPASRDKPVEPKPPKIVAPPPKPKSEPEPKPKVVIVTTQSGSVDNHIRRECGKLADLSFMTRAPKLGDLRQYDLVVLTKWCDKHYVKQVEQTYTPSEYVYIAGNADNIAEQLKIGLIDMIEARGYEAAAHA